MPLSYIAERGQKSYLVSFAKILIPLKAMVSSVVAASLLLSWRCPESAMTNRTKPCAAETRYTRAKSLASHCLASADTTCSISCPH